MDFQGFIKGILIDSLAGISFDNLSFIVFQFIVALFSILFVSKYLKLNSSKKTLIFICLLLTLMVMIASTSVPLAILSSSIALSYLLKIQKEKLNDALTVILIAYSAGSGHLILLFIALFILFIFSKIVSRNAQ